MYSDLPMKKEHLSDDQSCGQDQKQQLQHKVEQLQPHEQQLIKKRTNSNEADMEDVIEVVHLNMRRIHQNQEEKEAVAAA
jgi:hypothetical protein